MIFTLPIKRWLLIFLSFFVGLLLMFLQLPTGLHWVSPLWLVLIVLYWVFMMPQYVNVGVAWVFGIIIDAIYNVTLGTHALGLVLVAILMIKIREKILSLGLVKVTPVVFGLLVLYQTLIFLMQSYGGSYFSVWSILGGAVVGAIWWLLLTLLLFNLQRKFRI
ncbi:MAG: rod shape-determining protein MreD [Coxiellaceae bacterium]|jgi:rod shape-determining protein MreD|nr:rod shape-determining protein MreD [Coxiellaceae bacterium]